MLQIVLVVDSPALLNSVLEAWATAGVQGITLLIYFGGMCFSYLRGIG